MKDVNVFTLENGVEYIEIDQLFYNNIKYVLLCNMNNVKDSCIKKILLRDNLEYISELDSDSEFDVVLKMFVEKNKTLFN